MQINPELLALCRLKIENGKVIKSTPEETLNCCKNKCKELVTACEENATNAKDPKATNECPNIAEACMDGCNLYMFSDEYTKKDSYIENYSIKEDRNILFFSVISVAVILLLCLWVKSY